MGAFATLVDNIKAGTRLALMRPVDRGEFRPSADQAVLLLAIGVALDVAHDFVVTGAAPGLDFNLRGLSTLFAAILVFLFGAYLIARIQRAAFSFTAVVVVLASTSPVFYVVSTPLSLSIDIGSFSIDDAEYWVSTSYGVIVAIAILGWFVAIAFRAMRLLYDAGGLRTWALIGVFAASVAAGDYIRLDQALWYSDVARTSEDDAEDEWAEYRELDVEKIYYAQPRLIAKAAESLRPQRPGVVDLYFIAFGSYAYQDVFSSEVHAVRALFDKRFDTANRSLVLVNNLKTLESEPLANANNLRRALTEVARKMDPEEDVLFLFLTSHGSKDHRLSVNFWPLRLNNLAHDDLARMLDETGIKWRVVAVSACFSGGFIETLKNANSLIVTASRADRNSFGCSNERKFTYFGKAYFDQQLRRELSFIEAFHKATKVIEEWETEEDLTPSVPQIHVGSAVGAKLDALVRRLEELNGGDR